MKNKKHFNTTYNTMYSILPNCTVILPNSHANNVVNPILVKNILARQIYKKLIY
jgi:hypothetical protein